MPIKFKKFFLWGLGLMLCGVAVVVATFYAFVHHPDLRNRIVRAIASGYGVEIDTGSIQFDISEGLQVSASPFFIQAEDGQWSLKSNDVWVKLKPFSLLRPRLLLEQIRLDSPVLEVHGLKKPASASPSHFSGIKRRLEGRLLKEVRSIEIRNGAVGSGDVPWAVESLDIDVRRQTATGQAAVDLSATITENAASPTRVNAAGTIGLAGDDIDQAPIDIRVSSPSFDISRIPWPSMIPSVKGKSAVSIDLSGPLSGPLRYSGDLRMEGVELTLERRGRTKTYVMPTASAGLSGMLAKQSISIDTFSLKGPNATFSGSMDLDLSEPGEPKLYLMIQSEPMSLETFKTLYPDPLTNPWLSQELFPIFTNGVARLNHLTLNGAVSRISHMGEPGNRDTFAIGIAVEDISAFGGQWGPVISSISGEISISEGALEITRVSGKTGKSNLFEGSLMLPNLYDAPGVGDIAIKADIDLTDISPLKPAKYIPKVMKRLIEPVQALNGSAAAEVLLGVSERWKKVKWREGTIDISKAKMLHHKIPGTVFVEKGRMDVKEGAPSQYSGEGRLDASTIHFSGNIEENWDQYRLLVDLEVENGGELGQLLPKAADFVDILSPVTCNLSIDSQKEGAMHLLGFCPSNGLQVQGTGLRITPTADGAGIRFSLNKNATDPWRIDTLTYTGPSGEMNFSIPNGALKDLKSVQIQTQGMRLEDAGVFVAGATIPMTGSVSGEVDVEFQNTVTPRIKGALRIQGVTLPPFGVQPLTQGFDGELIFSGNTMEIFKGRLPLAGGEVSVQGRLSKGETLTGTIEARSAEIDLMKLLEAFHKNEGPGASAGPSKKDENPSKIELSFKFLADKLKWREFTVADATAGLRIKNGATRIEYAKGVIPGGKINLSGQIDAGKQISLSAHCNLSPQPLDELMRSLDAHTSKIKGTLGAEGFFFTSGSKLEECVQNLIGTVNFELKNGYFENASVFLKILDFLSVQNIFVKRPPNTAADAFYFHEIQGNVEVLGPKLKTEHIRMKSPVFNAIAAGELDWAKDGIDVKIGAQPLNTIDYLVSKIPIVGHILTGKEQSLLVYYFEVKGSLRNPEVVHVPFESLSKNFTGYIERLLLSPVQLFKQLSQMVRFLTSQGAELPTEE